MTTDEVTWTLNWNGVKVPTTRTEQNAFGCSLLALTVIITSVVTLVRKGDYPGWLPLWATACLSALALGLLAYGGYKVKTRFVVGGVVALVVAMAALLTPAIASVNW